MIDPNDTHYPSEPFPRESNSLSDYDEREDYVDHDVPKLSFWPATKHYRLLSWLFTVYGILCFLAGVGLVVFVFSLLPEINRRPYLRSDALGISIASVIVFLFSVTFLVLSRQMREQKSLWPLRILSFLACFLGASYFFCSYAVFTWLGIYGFVVVSQLSLRKQFGEPIPEYLHLVTDDTPLQEGVVSMDTQNQLQELKNELIAKTNRRYLSWIVPIVIGLLLGIGSFGIVTYNLIKHPKEAPEVVGVLGLVIGIILLVYLPALIAYFCIRSRRLAVIVWLSIAFNLLLGLMPFFGILHYAIGCWLFIVMCMPEVRLTYGKLR